MMALYLVTGGAGQDGRIATRLLLDRGEKVSVTVRTQDQKALLDIENPSATVMQLDVSYAREVAELVQSLQPDFLIHLAASSSVAESWTFPSESLQSNLIGTVNVLEAVKKFSPHTSVLLASSSEIYGRFHGKVLPGTPIVPSSPYGVGKATAKALGELYRDSYSLTVSSAVLFNHESPLRGPRFVTQQIATQAVEVFHGSASEILLGNPTIEKDFSWAPDIVKGMISLLDLGRSSDAILGSGELTSLSQLASFALESLDLPGGLVTVDPNFYRLNDSVHPVAGPGLGLAELGVKKHSPRFIMESMVLDKVRKNIDPMWFIYS